MSADEIIAEQEDTTLNLKTDSAVKSSLQELIKYGYLEESRKPTLFRSAVTYEAKLLGALEPLDLSLSIDTHRGLVLLVLNVAKDADPDAAWSHPLVRRQRLTLEQSLVLAMLREAFLMHEQERGVGQAIAKSTLDDLMPRFLIYLPDSGSENRNQSRLLSILDQLKTHGVVSQVDKNEEFNIRPLIVHLANAESLSELLKSYQTLAELDEST